LDLLKHREVAPAPVSGDVDLDPTLL